MTALDLGPEDRPAEFVWGANLAIRREAFERIGRFDEALGGAGDEEDWQRRLRAAGGSVGYVAAAGVDHRRSGRDAHLRQLARASYFRGRAARRYGVFRGHAPSLPPSSARCSAACGTSSAAAAGSGVTMAAHSYGRLAEALDPAPAPPNAADPDYLSGRSGTLGRRGLLVGAVQGRPRRDREACARGRRSRRAARRLPRRRVHVVGVVRPEHLRTVARLRRELSRSKHDVALHLVAPAPDAGKWANINAALAAAPPAGRRLAADRRRRRDPPARLPRPLPGHRRGLRPRARPARPRLRLARRLGRHPPPPGDARAPHPLRRDRPRDRALGAPPRASCCRSPTCAWAGASTAPGARSRSGTAGRSASSTPRPIRHLRPVASTYPRDDADRRGRRFLADRPYVTRDEAVTVAEYRELPA